MSAGDTPAVAAFDFDGTLTSGDSLWRFLHEVCGTKSTLSTLARHFRGLAWSAIAGGTAADQAKAAVFQAMLAGRDSAELASAGERFAAHLLARRHRPEIVARLGWHRSQGHHTVIVSASPEIYLVPAGRHLGTDGVIATRLAVGSDGRLTGGMDGDNCRGPEKARRLTAWLDERGLAGKARLWAYGNSAGDRDLLAMADVPVNVGRLGRIGKLGRQFPATMRSVLRSG